MNTGVHVDTVNLRYVMGSEKKFSPLILKYQKINYGKSEQYCVYIVWAQRMIFITASVY